jgi:hypothetical protein
MATLHLNVLRMGVTGTAATHDLANDLVLPRKRLELLNFNVRDESAFDIDESVQLEFLFYGRDIPERVTLTYDRAEAAPAMSSGVANDPAAIETIDLSAGEPSPWQTRTVELEHARFANRGFGGTDVPLSTSPTYEADASGQHFKVTPHEFTVCAIQVKRSYTTPIPSQFGDVSVQVLDERAVRVDNPSFWSRRPFPR